MRFFLCSALFCLLACQTKPEHVETDETSHSAVEERRFERAPDIAIPDAVEAGVATGADVRQR